MKKTTTASAPGLENCEDVKKTTLYTPRKTTLLKKLRRRPGRKSPLAKTNCPKPRIEADAQREVPSRAVGI